MGYLRGLFCLLITVIALMHSVCAAAPLMVEKNLFAADRKAPAAEGENASRTSKAEGLELLNIQLNGVMIQGDTRKALVRLKNVPLAGLPPVPASQNNVKGRFVSISEGQQISDFRVSKIESKSISIEKDGQRFVFDLLAKNKIESPPGQSLSPGVAPDAQDAGQVPPEPDSQQGMEMQPANNEQ